MFNAVDEEGDNAEDQSRGSGRNQRENKALIRNKIKTGECVLENVKGKSNAWNLFKKIMYTNNNEAQCPLETGYVYCTKCTTILTYNSTDGLSHINRHKCPLINQSNTINVFFEKKRKLNIPSKVANEAIDHCIKFCSLDIRPFEILDGEGFKQLCQFLINTGARYGQVDAAELLPHPTTVSRNCLKMAATLRNELLKNVIPYFDDGRCAATTDMWTDDLKKIGYTAITLHYINDEWQLKSNLLCVRQFDLEKKKLEKI